ncbi:MAG TPA: D-Ala-D-Ala carboxypeptidase family metallohydrolase [Myxococcota bacterium]|nr:D-Ala-D-Ala carboxypeptidase family metallohydrolase [Myxococcota bacterium]
MQARSLHVLPLALALALAAPGARAATPDGARFWDASAVRARFELRHGDVSSRLRVALASVLPGETLDLSARDRSGARLPVQITGSKSLRQTLPGAWTFTAPSRPGLHRLRVASADAQDEIALNVFVLVPSRRLARGRINGYEIGRYPAAATVQGARVDPPPGFIEVTRKNEDTLVSPHFRLSQFLCKERGEFPKYVLVDARLLAKLEALLDALNQHGIAAQSLEIMSGYRTPAYNREIGNSTTWSRHLWGDAADVFVDRSPRDGRMDDLDGNGVVDARDAELLYALADALDRDPPEDWSIGGAGYYAATAAHGPFLHLDVRGHTARW